MDFPFCRLSIYSNKLHELWKEGKKLAKIGDIGTVEYTDASKAKIDAARSAYDALTAEQKALVSNYESLTKAPAETNWSSGASGISSGWTRKNPDGSEYSSGS